jgi:lipopolysaccharide transport system permease protein
MKNQSWIIKKHTRFDFNFREIWAYRDLLALLVHKDIISFYKQTLLGPAWLLLQPLLTTVTYTLIFGNVAMLSTDGSPKPLFYLAGITLWNYFSECFNKVSNVLKDNAEVFGKVYFPRLLVPVSVGISNLIKSSLQFILFLLCSLVYHLKGTDLNINWTALFLPVLILLVALQGIGLGMIVASMTIKYRDFLFLVGFGLQLLMYSTTVIYPLSAAPDHIKWIIKINPLTAVIETFRCGFLGHTAFDISLLTYSIITTLMLFTLGIVLFNGAEKNFVDSI